MKLRAADTTDFKFMIGQTVSHYRILEAIGDGEPGELYRVEDVRDGFPRRLHLLPADLEPAAQARTVREATHLEALDPLYLEIPLTHGETADGRLYLVADERGGETLASRLVAGPLRPDDAVATALQITDGLCTAHQAGLVHGSLDREQVLVVASGTARITGFGLGHLRPAGRSPEQWGGGEASPQSDLWAVGALLYEMLAGRPPTKPSADSAPPIALSRSGAAALLTVVLSRTLAVDPAARYADAGALLEALRTLHGLLADTLDGEEGEGPPGGKRVAVSRKNVGGYEVLDRLGGGGMGEVYRARDLKLGRYVALKFLAPHLSRSAEEKQRFLQEARAASALDHPNICTIHGLDETADGYTFIAMACYEGETLDRRIGGQPLPLEDILAVGWQIASGLAAAHRRGIIHRDIKPANLLLTDEGVLKILDFGISKLSAADNADLTRAGTLLGTVGYLSPEQAQGEEADRQTDIWALGVVLYEMATGRRPFVAGNDLAILHKIAFGQIEPPSSLVPDIDPELERIILRAMAHDKAQRYPDLETLLVDWEALASRVGVHTSAYGALSSSGSSAAITPPVVVTAPTVVARRPALRRRLPLLVAVLVLVVLAAGFWWWRARTSPPVAARQAIFLIPLEDRSGTTDTAWLGTAISEMVALLLEDEVTVQGLGQGAESPAAANAQRRLEGSYRWLRGGTGETIELDLQLVDAAGSSLALSSVQGPVSALLLLASDAVSSLGFSRPGESGAAAGEMPGAEVARLAGQGEEALWRLDALAARGYFEQALAQAPDRATLDLGLAEALGLLGYEDEQQIYVQRAVEHSRQLGLASRLTYRGQALRAQRAYNRAAALLRALWLTGGGSGVDHLRRGIELAYLLSRADEGEAAEALLAELEPLAKGDPRLSLTAAEVAYRLARYRRAQEASRRAAAAAVGEEARFLRARACHLEGEALRRLGAYDEAVPLLEEARQIYVVAGHAKGEGDVHYTLANLAWDRRDLAAAKASYEAAVRRYATIGNRRMQARTLANQGLLLSQRGDLEAAIEIFRQALALFRESGDRQAAAVTLINLASSYALSGRFAEADEAYEGIFMLLGEAPEPSIEGFARAQKGGYLVSLGRLAAARRELDAAFALQGATGDRQLLANVKFNFALLLHMQGEPRQAQEVHAEALDILAESGTGSALYLQVRASYCDLLSSRGELEAAINCFHEVLVVQKDLVNPLDAAETRLGVAAWYLAADQPAAAAELAGSAIADLERRGAVLLAIRAHGLLAHSLLLRDELADAERELDSARQLLGDRDSPPLVLPLALLEVRLHLARGDTEGARQALQAVLAAATQASLSELELEADLLLGVIELKDGNAHAGRSRLLAVAAEAERKGYGLLAAQARERAP